MVFNDDDDGAWGSASRDAAAAAAAAATPPTPEVPWAHYSAFLDSPQVLPEPLEAEEEEEARPARRSSREFFDFSNIPPYTHSTPRPLSPPKINHISIIGERHSGTNFLYCLLHQNINASSGLDIGEGFYSW
jgi:hypothetical protein